MKNIIQIIHKNLTLQKTTRLSRRVVGGIMMFSLILSSVYGLFVWMSSNVKTVEAATSWGIRQEINIIDGYVGASSGAYATSSGIINIEKSRYSGTTQFYLEVVASSSAPLSTNFYLKKTTGETVATLNASLTTSYGLYRSSTFVPPATVAQGDFRALGQTARDWSSIGINPNTNDIYVGVASGINPGDIYKQTAGGGTFTALGQTMRYWNGLAVNRNTNDVYAVVSSGDIYKQTAGTGNFVALSQTSRSWSGIAVNPNTNDVYATVSNGDIYKQTAGTGNFVALGQTSRNWQDIAVNTNTNEVYAVVLGGDIYEQDASANFVLVVGNESGATKGVKAARVVALQSFAGTSNSGATSTQTQIEIGNREITKSNTSTSPLSSPKYWTYNSSLWDENLTFSAEVTYKNNGQIASTTTYTVPGTYTYTPSSRGVTYAQVELWGAGGAGRCSASVDGGGGGGGGAYARSTTTPTFGTSYTVVVAATTTCNTTTSNDSTFASTVVVADGGTGAGASPTGATGGTVATSTGQVVYAGGRGGNALGTSDTGGGGGGAAGPLGAGGNGSAGPSAATTSGGGGGGGNNGSSASNTATGAAGGTGGGTGGNGGASANGSNGASATQGGGGGGGSGSTALQGGAGGSPGGGGGGGDTTQTGTLGNGGRGQARITETHGAIGIALEEDNGSFGGWTFKQMIVTNGVATSSPQRVRSNTFTPVSGRNYRLVASTTNASATYDIYNAKIIVNQTSSGSDVYTAEPFQFSKLETQYLLANTLLSSGTALQSNLTKWDSTEWTGTQNTYVHQVDAASNSTSVVTINTASGGTLVTGSTVTSPNNVGVSGTMTMPADGNLDMKATTNNNDVYGSRILVRVAPILTISGTVFGGLTGITSTLSGKTISAYKNGSTFLGSAVTDGDGAYTIAVQSTYAVEDIITLYIDGDTTKGVTVVQVQNGKSLSNINIYGNTLSLHNDAAVTMGVGDVLTGYVSGDTADMVHTFQVGGTTTMLLNQNVNLYVSSGYIISGGQIQTQGTGDLVVANNATLSLDTGTNTIAGDVMVNTATLDLSSDIQIGSGFAVTGGSTVSGSGTVSMVGSGTIQSGDYPIALKNLTISSTGNISSTADITLSGTLTVQSSGSLVSSSGTVTGSGTAWNIVNAGTLSFYNLTIGETPTTQPSASFSVNGTLTVSANKTFAPTAGTVTMTGGSIVNNSTLSFYDLAISGSVSTGSTFNVVDDFTSNSLSSFSTTKGFITVEGDLVLNGTISGSGSVVARGDVTGNGVFNLSAGIFNLQGIGSFGGNTNWNINALDIGVPTETGQYQTAVVYGGQIYISSDYGNTWTAKESNRSWTDIAISATGKYQTAVAYSSQIYVSSDYGNTWTAKDSNRDWYSVAVSSTGQYQTATGYNVGQYIYVSSDYGNTWVAKTGPTSEASGQADNVSMSATGQYQTATTESGLDFGIIFTSSDYGNTWIERSGPIAGGIPAVSSTGQYQAFGQPSGGFWFSSNYGASWSAVEYVPYVSGISISGDGKYTTITGTGPGALYTSSNYGASGVLKDYNSNNSWYDVAVSSTGKYQTAVSSLGLYVSPDFGVTWTQKEQARNWSGVAMSNADPMPPTGKYQTSVVYGGQIYISSNYGNTWTAKDSNRNWRAVAVSSTYQYQTAVAENGQLYISSDYGNTWTAKDSSRSWRSVSVSSTGQYQTAVAYYGQIYISSDYGNTWTAKDSSRAWFKVSMSSNGQYQTAVAAFGDQIYVSSNYGNTWTTKDSARDWRSVSVSSTGQYQTATVFGGQIYISSDYGNTWTAKDSNRNWYSVSVSSTGQYQTSVVNAGQIYASSDYGNTWTVEDSNRNWVAVSVSSNGQYQTAVIDGGQIYISSDYGNTWTAKDSSRSWTDVSISSSVPPTSVSASGTGSITTATASIIGSFDLGSKLLELTSSFQPLQILGNLIASSSTIRYSGTSNTTVTPATYYNLEFMPVSGSIPTYTLGTTTGQIFTINNNFTIAGAERASGVAVDANTYDPVVNVSGNMSVGQEDTFQVSDVSTTTVVGDISINGTLSGGGNVVVQGGNVTGNGTANLSSGTFTVSGVGSFGGNTDWNFNNITVASTGGKTGQYQTAVVPNGQIYVSSDYGNTWTAKESNRNWYGVSISSTGQYQTAAVVSGQIYISSDYGNTWIAKDSSRNWEVVSVSSTGQYQTAVTNGEKIYVSSDYGNTWTAKESNRQWWGVSISSTGQYQTAAVVSGQIYISSDYGNTWTAKDSIRSWRDVSVSSTGQYQTAVADQIYISSDYGNTWTAKDSIRGWRRVAVSSTGQYQTAPANNGQIYISSDYGNTWTAKESTRSWFGVAVSSTGQYQTAGEYNGQIYISSDYGNTWIAKDSSRIWWRVSMSNTAPSTSISALGSGSITTGTATINGTLDLGSKTLNLTSSGAPLSISGSLIASSSTIKYSGSTDTTVTSATYYNLRLEPVTFATPVYTLGSGFGQTIYINNDFTISNIFEEVNVDADAFDPIINVQGNMTLNFGGIFNASPTSPLSIKGNFTNEYLYLANGGTLTFTNSGPSVISSLNDMAFYNISATTPGKTLKFKSRTGNAPVFTINGTMTVTGSASTPVYIESDSSSNQWLVNFLNPQNSITYASIRDAGCKVGSAVVAFSNTNINRENNDTCWGFPVILRGGGGGASIGGDSGGGTLVTGGTPGGGQGQGQGVVESGSGGGTAQTGGGQSGGSGQSNGVQASP